MNKLKSLFFAFAFFILSINFIFADDNGISSSSLEAADSVNSLSKKTGVGQQSNFLPDAQLAMSESLYPVTAGDIYKLAFVAGTNTVSYSILVDSTYKIRIANLALIDCKGLTFIELKNKVISVVQKNYPMGAVYQPGRYPYIPDRNWDYYIGLAGGFIKEKNAASSDLITDVHGNEHKKDEFILPEMTIEAKTNSGLYYFNQYAPVITTLLSAISTSITIMVVTGVIK